MTFGAYGPPEALAHRDDAPLPTCGANQVLVKVHAASVNPVDWQLASGKYRWIVPTCLPAVPGSDVSGQVIRVGRQVKGTQTGDQVCALTPTYGGCAEYAVVNGSALARSPSTMSRVEAAALPLAGVTALQCLRDHGGLGNATRRVLVVGASGGVGHYAVQIARAAGAHVVGVCSGKNASLVKELGADEAIDYTQHSDFGGDYDIVLDTVGGQESSRLFGCLAKQGRYVATNPSGGDIARTLWTRLTGSRRYNGMLFRPRRRDLAVLVEMAERGELRSVVEQTFALHELSRAHRRSMTGRVRGKVVVTIP